MTGLEDVSSVDEVARFLKIDPDKLKRLARAKRIGHIRAGRQYLFPREAVECYVRDNTVEAMPLSTNPHGLTDSAYRRLQWQKRD